MCVTVHRTAVGTEAGGERILMFARIHIIGSKIQLIPYHRISFTPHGNHIHAHEYTTFACSHFPWQNHFH